MMNSEIGAPPDDDNESQSSQRSAGRSLLERIRMQQQQHQQQATPQMIQVPQYSPVPSNENFAGGGPAPPEPASNSFFADAWNNITTSMETGMAGLDRDDEALLAPTTTNHHHHHLLHDDNEHYSMRRYFMTFVQDVYTAFLSVPVVGRIVIVIVLIYVALKLL